MLKWEKYEKEVTKRFGMQDQMDQMTQYLHDTGKVIWFSDHPTLRSAFCTFLKKKKVSQ